MKEIKLTQGQFSIVDDDMFEDLNQFKWHADKDGNTFYAKRNACNNGKWKKVLMHREILGLIDRNIHCDHINHNGLDNRKINLRKCSGTQNRRNQIPLSGCSSKYKGVSWRKTYKKWVAIITVDRKRIHLGSFVNEIEAANAYDKAAKVHHKEFAYTNF